MFNLFDENRDGRIDQSEMVRILAQGGVRGNDAQLETLFRLLDSDKSGKISYNELCEVIDGKKQPDFEKFVREERAKRKQQSSKGGDAFVTEPLTKKADVGSSQMSRDEKLGKVEGISEVIGNSGRTREVPKLTEGTDAMKI